MGKALDNDFGAKAVVVPFANVGSVDGSFKLRDIKPIAIEKVTEADLINAISFQRLDAGGLTIDGTDRVWDGSKWALFDGTDKSDETYVPGAGVWMFNGSYNPSSWECGIVDLQSSGQVIQENVIADLDNDFGAVFVGNPFATPIKLSNIIPYVEEGAIAPGAVSFQKLDAGGLTVDGTDRVWDGSKWTLFDGTDKSDETLEPGEGVWMFNGNYDEKTWACIPGKVRFVAPEF